MPTDVASTYQKVYATIRKIPRGRVSTYGRIAARVDSCTARMVGYALAASRREQDLPWHRVINHQGKISNHGEGVGSGVQRKLLEREGVRFDSRERVDLQAYGWPKEAGRKSSP